MNPIYTNTATLYLGNLDITIKFGIVKGTDDGMETEHLDSYIMSPQHFKLLTRKMNEILLAFEQQWGVVRVEPLPEGPQLTKEELMKMMVQSQGTDRHDLPSITHTMIVEST